jgi:hypothetical protein
MGRFASLEPMLMKRSAAVVFGLLLGAQACASPAPNQTALSTPEVQATAVQRTAVAEVQRIIAGNLSGGATPEPTATPAPECGGAIWWYEARSHIGETRTVQGPVVASRSTPDARTLLQIGQPYPDPSGITVLLPQGDEARLAGRTICVLGRIASPATVPTIELHDASSIFVLK